MGTSQIKYLVSVLYFTLFLCSCSNSSIKMVPKEEYDVKTELVKEQKNELQEKVNRNILLETVIYEVLVELRELTKETSIIRNNLENNLPTDNIEEIKERIQTIKQKLKKQSSKDKNNISPKMLSISQELFKSIEEKEKEINYLKKQIIDKDKVIDTQKENIDDLTMKLNIETGERWYHMGIELHNAAINLPEVKKKKDQKEIIKSKYYFLQKSKKCFEQAKQYDRTDSDRMIQVVNREIYLIIKDYPDVPHLVTSIAF